MTIEVTVDDTQDANDCKPTDCDLYASVLSEAIDHKEKHSDRKKLFKTNVIPSSSSSSGEINPNSVSERKNKKSLMSDETGDKVMKTTHPLQTLSLNESLKLTKQQEEKEKVLKQWHMLQKLEVNELPCDIINYRNTMTEPETGETDSEDHNCDNKEILDSDDDSQ